jgi:hypothetical protein
MRNPGLGERRRAPRLIGREGRADTPPVGTQRLWWISAMLLLIAGWDPVRSHNQDLMNSRSSAGAAIPPCVVSVCNDLVTCRSAVNQSERQLFDWGNANSRPEAELRIVAKRTFRSPIEKEQRQERPRSACRGGVRAWAGSGTPVTSENTVR